MLSNKSSNKQDPDKPFSFSYESMGIWWEIRIWDDLNPQTLHILKKNVIDKTHNFDKTYSRFNPDSYVMKTFQTPGEKTIPEDLSAMLKLYTDFYDATNGKITPLIGQALSDAGYDSNYSLKTQKISDVPDYKKTIEFLANGKIYLHRPVTLDLGAIGKGYFVDILGETLKKAGCSHYLINGSGDLKYVTPRKNDDLRIGLEHPENPKQVLGLTKLSNASVCSSGTNRRAWGSYHHILDPQTKSSPQNIKATWVQANNTAQADGLATSLFLVEPRQLRKKFSFEYAMLSHNMILSRSSGFSIYNE